MPQREGSSPERASSVEVDEDMRDEDMRDYSASENQEVQEEASSEDDNYSTNQDNNSLSAVINTPITINVPEISNASEYTEGFAEDSAEETAEDSTEEAADDVEEPTIQTILSQSNRTFQPWYKVIYEGGREDEIPSSKLTKLPNGTKALDLFLNNTLSDEDSDPIVAMRNTRSMSSTLGKRGRPAKKVTIAPLSDSDDELAVAPKRLKLRYPSRSVGPLSRAAQQSTIDLIDDDSEEESDRPRGRATRSSARAKASKPNYGRGEETDDRGLSDDDFVQDVVSDIKPKKKKDGRGRPPKHGGLSKLKARKARLAESSSEDERPEPSRRSERNTKAAKSMKEVNEDEEMYAEESAHSRTPKVVNVREVFQALPPKSAFRTIHAKHCDSCKGQGTLSNKGSSQLIHCQGCTTSIHQACLGPRSAREHMVTKVGDNSFVMQCRRCIGSAKKKDPTAPSFDVCQVCKIPGAACAAFSQRKTPKQEEKLRADNGGVDPITEVPEKLLNNADNVMFRCIQCHLATHFEHLPSPEDNSRPVSGDESVRDVRIDEYTHDFLCNHCSDVSGEDAQGLVAWRPIDVNAYNPKHTVDEVAPENKEYLIRWADRSYFQCSWMPGAWVWGIVSPATRKAFAKREENQFPKMTDEDAIPEEWLRMEIVLDVSYTSNVNTHTETIDRARIKEVDQVLVKFQGLGYDEVVWEHPPDPSDTERWADFEAAYNEYLVGKYFKQPPTDMQKRIDKFRKMDFESQILFDQQPAALTGGQLMDYQMEGLNWLLFNYHQKKSVILADEMGLGKTLQIISMITALVKEKPKTWPFLVVVPNSTCPNWRREIKTWAPSLRVVAYYGSKEAREMAMKYELYPNGRKDLAAHIVVTSYECPVEESSRQFFRKIRWAGVIVDEGQRLKNDKNLLYVALQGLHTPFKVLMTGTPLQNNKRELFNLLAFIDDSIDAEALDEEYEELTNENIPQLHEKIKPYFLRRTKATALSFLPPLGQVIVPVTMSTLQKSLYKSILSRNPELMKSIFTIKKTLKPAEKGNLNNILMQLRKVLCHPFMFSQAVEERALPQNALHRNLVQASPKLQLLEIMLPKLRERGHRVLIFSQFLDQLDIVEDFLMGLNLQFERLDGQIGTLEKQRRIDAFNAPDSPLFAFLLSTRAGGVGINLATADTVIIMDPDFNPHQDVQALSRAHRIGQKKKVLVFQLMTKDSAEEKIVQIGRKKMALDHVLIESLDQEEDAGVDLESILKHGATALFEGNDENDIHYNSASVDKLLDRTGIEHTNAGADKTAESAFSFARVWANDKGALVDDMDTPDSPASAEDNNVWDKLLEERAAEAAREAEKRKEALGKGKRVRKQINYNVNRPAYGAVHDGDDSDDASPKSRSRRPDHSDTDFAEDAESDAEDEEPDEGGLDPRELEPHVTPRKGKGIASQEQTKQVGEFRRVRIAQPLPINPLSEEDQIRVDGGNGSSHSERPRPTTTFSSIGDGSQRFAGSGSSYQQPSGPVSSGQQIYKEARTQVKKCLACGQMHAVGYCTLKRSGHEHCGLCGLAHFGGARACPHMQSETQVRSMLRALKNSTEPKEDRKAARKYLQGVIGNLVMKKKKDAQREAGIATGQPQGLENQPPALFQQSNDGFPGQHSSIAQPNFEHPPRPPLHARPMQPSNGNSVPRNATYIDLDGP